MFAKIQVVFGADHATSWAALGAMLQIIRDTLIGIYFEIIRKWRLTYDDLIRRPNIIAPGVPYFIALHVHLFAIIERFAASTALGARGMELIVSSLQHLAGNVLGTFVATNTELGIVIPNTIWSTVSGNVITYANSDAIAV